MIIPRYSVAASLIPHAGKGLFIEEAVRKGAVIIAPDNVHTVWPESQLRKFSSDSPEVESSVRWFEDRFSLTPEWSDECYVNHSFAPNALWHLGFIFALDDLAAGAEITMDYRHVIGDAEQLPFNDSVTNRPIVGLHWPDTLRETTKRLLELL